MKQLILALLGRNRQIIKYGLIGCCCAALDYVVFLGLFAFLKNEFSVAPFAVQIASQHFGNVLLNVNSVTLLALLANAVSVNCGIFVSFFANRHFTFQVKDLTVHRFASFYLVGIMGLLLSSLLLVAFTEGFNMETQIAKGITIFFVALTQFLLNKFVSFKNGN
jgi:putative flippase GtrA